jgi:hypothetical protein
MSTPNGTVASFAVTGPPEGAASIVNLAAGPGLFVNAKDAEPEIPGTAALTWNAPAMVSALHADELARPPPSVSAESTDEPVLENLTLAPDEGAVNTTRTFGTGFFPSVTITCRESAKSAFTTALCGVPPFAEMPEAEPGSFVRRKSAGTDIPAAVAETE